MANISYSHRLDTTAIHQLLNSPQRGVVQDLMRRGLLVETQAKRNLGGVGGPRRVDTGRLRSSVNSQLVQRNSMPAMLIGTNVRYARMVHDGTGIWGPRHRVIRPKHGKYLRFKSKRTGKYVFARSVVGMKPNRFLFNALPAARG